MVILNISVLNEWCWVNIIPFWVLWELPESRELKLSNSSPPLFLHKKDKCSSFECKLWIATLNSPSTQSLYGLQWICRLPNPNFVLKIKAGTLFWWLFFYFPLNRNAYMKTLSYHTIPSLTALPSKTREIAKESTSIIFLNVRGPVTHLWL